MLGGGLAQEAGSNTAEIMLFMEQKRFYVIRPEASNYLLKGVRNPGFPYGKKNAFLL
jgi:hypothetical protein